MNPSRYFMPMIRQNTMTNIRNMSLNNQPSFNILSLFGKLNKGIKNFNWRGLLSGMNKTLNVVNQTIPLVRQAKPMFDNVKSVVRLTKSFKEETKNRNNKKHNNNNNNNNNVINKQTNNVPHNINEEIINKPIFFI